MGSIGTPLVAAAVASGTAVPLKGMTPGAQVKEGQFLTFVHAGRRYDHIFAADGTVGAGGTLSAAIWPLLRTPLSNNDVVEMPARMEGLVSPGDEISWQISVDRLASFSFTLAEGA